MKCRLLPVVLLLAACSGPVGREFGSASTGLNVADAALRGGSPQVALQVVNEVLAHDPANTQALLIQGDALTLQGRNDAAAASFERALARSPSSERGLIGLGRLRLATSPPEAERLFLAVLQTDPYNTVALNNLGIARDLQGRHADAQTAYRQALGINPDMTAAQVNLALSLAMDGQGAEAISLIQPLAAASGASRKIRHDYAAVLALSGRRAEAEQILSADLTRAEVAQAMAEYGSKARSTGATPPPPRPDKAIPFQGSSVQPLPGQPAHSVARAGTQVRISGT
jgi:Flp pilus assembly protein TadD